MSDCPHKKQRNMRKIIMDCDTGVDDAYAIQFLLNSDVNILAFTTVTGNCNAVQASKNISRLLTANKRNIPIYVGQKDKLLSLGEVQCCSEFHGVDGFGNVPYVFPTIGDADASLIKEESGVSALARLINENVNEVELIATGPLTNLAVLISLYPDISTKLKSLTIMGGNMNGIGNAPNCLGEFNFYGDPEASKMVLDGYSAQCKMTLVTWEATLKNLVPSSIYLDMKNKSTVGNLLYAITQHSFEKFGMETEYSGIWCDFKGTGLLMCDLLAAIVCVYPQMIQTSESFPCTVELSGKYSRSMMVVDRNRNLLSLNGDICLPITLNMEEIVKLDAMKFY